MPRRYSKDRKNSVTSKVVIEDLYEQLMSHADSCAQDVETHRHNLTMHMAMYGGMLPSTQNAMAILIEQSEKMEAQSHAMAYALLKTN